MQLTEQIPDPPGALADQYLVELRPGRVEEGHARLARHRARQQRLAGARRAHQSTPLGSSPPRDECNSLNRSLTLLAPWPTSISSNSGPAAWKKGTRASPATARASSVLPVPGGPTRARP
ncbi:hypothetical protein O0L34_g13329 [Tuta absoluta]|nr:hypothetical protein O0L34_g13323 [Tuta absoluta]KAJ2938400.1 hypothetical protein O0L34_g13324 [Tuta absoluta]KAJ2938401.1 hypothetical protein O0L34_g13324 [Tuta absoluta]KAJ2938402.1 hypothetical protein O0L34_g13324 [Tuta absoluta]KAJ2938403.1 hypothetical protein O0L34_g13325 [Tuta absoluta]